jgi:hypothetical protein
MKRIFVFLALLPLLAANGGQLISTGNRRTVTSPPPSLVAGYSLRLSSDCITFVSSVCGVPSNGTNITAWADRSGNANDATLNHGTCTFNTNQVNGKPAVTFSSCWGALAFTVPPSGCCIDRETAFAVYSVGTSTNSSYIYGSGYLGPAYATATDINFQSFSAQDDHQIGVGQVNIAANTFVQTNFVWLNGTEINFRISSAVDKSAPYSSSNIIGGPTVIGTDGNSTGSGQLSAKLVELIVYQSALTLPQIQQNEAYFRFTYGIS